MDIKIIPLISEKTFAEAQSGIYVFDVPRKATKQQIASAVHQQFSVDPQTVNTIVSKGKVKQGIRKGARVTGKRPDTKKAYVRVSEGQTIPLFTENAAAAQETK